ncbi:aspartate carbamoyltransferase [Streptococcus acidominimus]|uniref:Aspartate carbamoyltransferase n=1 Tax=Streptococcus acidominimus TaxID=1326 RepID=A0A239X7D8_STRAI|nr:aspartate carbamoyltransferase catalytic subunit [Streptococcus acidominimus]SNV42340.1 aspartate carbamoyltransferase [Streptococcus acidominimus]
MSQISPIALPHLVSMETLAIDQVMAVIERGLALKRGADPVQFHQQIFVANLFFENSTRTHKSFEVAEKRLGLDVIDFHAETSSVNKGETLYDTILTMDALGVDLCVVRHPAVAFYQDLIESPSLNTAIINGGDGSGQHPSQCLLDLMTIYEEFGYFKGLKICIAGDITHSRVARSNMQILKRLGATLYFSGPKEWYTSDFDQFGQQVDLDEIIDDLDVLMLLRVQHERHVGQGSFSKQSYHEAFGLTQERYDRLGPLAIMLHPAPVNRDVEIADHLVESPKSRIVTQMTNGVYVRMAILEAILQARYN